MYAESHVRKRQVSGLCHIIENAPDMRPRPPDYVQAEEEGGAFARLLTAASTEDERLLVDLLDAMLDRLNNEDMRATARKGVRNRLRGELRARFVEARGGLEGRYYKAFRGLERMATA